MLKHKTYKSALRMDVGLLTSHNLLNRWGRVGCAPLFKANLLGQLAFSTSSGASQWWSFMGRPEAP